MDLLAFFQAIIPPDGFKFLIEVRANGTKAHYPYDTFEGLVEKAEEFIANGKPFYHACSSYKEIKYNEWGYAIGRTQDNVKWVKALWQDIDVGKVDKATGVLKADNYASKKEAWIAVQAMCKIVGMPEPMLVDSGNGLHCYWPFEEAIPPNEWVEIALLARAAFKHVGFKFDTSRDADCASILRPVGSDNKGKTVTVRKILGPKSHLYYKELLFQYIKQNGVVPPTKKETFVNEFAGTPTEFPPSSMERVAERCQQVQEFRDTGGGSYDQWRGNMGLAKHCVDGFELAHTWGLQYPGYKDTETNDKMEGWTKGPTTCEYFEKSSAEGCKECPFKGKIKSPIVLGYSVETEAPQIEIKEDDGTITLKKIPYWPDSFDHTKGGVLRMMIPDKEGVPQPIRVASPLFYLTERIKSEDGTFVYTVRMNVRGGDQGEWRTFELPAKYLAETRALKSTLASYEIVVYNDKLLEFYVQDYAVSLRKHEDEINTFKQFGWNEERTGFLIGSSLITKQGRRDVRISREYIRDEKLIAAGIVEGSKKEWSDGVEVLYNRKNGEPWQYAICTQFGAPLVELLDYEEWNGIPLALTSGDSGYGKSTVIKIGINALSDSRKTTITDTTPKGIVGRASVMNNLPFLVDEVTQSLVDPQDVTDVLYTLSSGNTRVGMNSDGRERVPLPPYKSGSSVTGNKNLYGQIMQSKHNPEAVQMRVFEIAMEDYGRMDSLRQQSTIHAAHHELALHLVNNVRGVWADDYFDFVMANLPQIKRKLHDTSMSIVRVLGGDAAKERFFAYHMACTMVGGWIAMRIGAIQFNMPALKMWSFSHIKRLRDLVGEYSANVDDKFSNLLSGLHGSILVTKHFDLLDTKSNTTEVPMLPIREAVNARLVLGSDKERGKLFISVKAIDDWCTKNNISPVSFRRQLSTAGILRMVGDQGRGFDRKISLSRGVPSHPMGRCRCIELEYSVAQGYVEEHLHAGNVVDIATALPLPPTEASSPALQQLPDI